MWKSLVPRAVTWRVNQCLWPRCTQFHTNMLYQRCSSSRKWRLLQQRRVQNKYHTCQGTLRIIWSRVSPSCARMAGNNVNWIVVVTLLSCYIIAFGLAIAAEEHRAQVSLFPQSTIFTTPTEIPIRTRLLFSEFCQIWFQRTRNPSMYRLFLSFVSWSLMLMENVKADSDSYHNHMAKKLYLTGYLNCQKEKLYMVRVGPEDIHTVVMLRDDDAFILRMQELTPICILFYIFCREPSRMWAWILQVQTQAGYSIPPLGRSPTQPTLDITTANTTLTFHRHMLWRPLCSLP